LAARRYKPPQHTSTEFELDLAPLLAVMVKLVPVLLISAAFVQVSIVETELPQVVKEAIQREDDPNQPKKATVQLRVDKSRNVEISVAFQGQQNDSKIAAVPGERPSVNIAAVHAALVATKSEYSNTFRIEFAPSPEVSYAEIVRLMDTARKTNETQFEIIDPKTGQPASTKFMFPDVVFTNMLE
jgi:biopolymer transport protein ExbD